MLALAAVLVWASDGNRTIFLVLNHALSGSPDLWSTLTILGDATVALCLLLPFCDRRPRLVVTGLLAAVLTTIWVQGLKSGLALPRPAAVLDAMQINVIGHTLHARSFPSGHSATASVLAGLVVLGMRPRTLWCWLAVGVALLVALSRIVVGAHWPLDVLVGAAGGWTTAALACGLVDRAGREPGQRGQRFMLVLLVAVAVYLLLFHDTGYAAAEPWPRVIALLCLLAARHPLRAFFVHRRAGGRG